MNVFEESKETFFKKFLWRVQGSALLAEGTYINTVCPK